METRLNTLYYLFYYNVLHRIHVHIYLSGTILNGRFSLCLLAVYKSVVNFITLIKKCNMLD